MLKILYADYFSLSSAIAAQFTLKMCVAARNSEKFTQTLYFAGSKSFNVMELGIPKSL